MVWLSLESAIGEKKLDDSCNSLAYITVSVSILQRSYNCGFIDHIIKNCTTPDDDKFDRICDNIRLNSCAESDLIVAFHHILRFCHLASIPLCLNLKLHKIILN